MRKRKKQDSKFQKKVESKAAFSTYTFFIKTPHELKQVVLANIPLFIILGLIIFIIYANTISGQFVTADDIPGIVNNPLVRNLSASVKSLEIEKAYPAIVFAIFGMTPEPFHLLSIALHIISTCAAFLLVYTLAGKKTAVWTSFLFALHPINTEAVSWISAYSYMILTILSVGMILSFLLYRTTGNKKLLYISVVTWVLILVFYRKPWALLVPVMLFLIDQFLFFYKPKVKNMWLHLWYWVPSLVYGLVWLKGLYASRVGYLETLYYVDVKEQTPYIQRFLYTVFMTVKLLVFPKDLTIYHEGEVVGSFWEFYSIAIVVTLAIASIVLFTYVKSLKSSGQVSYFYRIISLSITLIYTSIAFSFSPRVVVWSTAERYLYFGTIFFCLILALLAQKFPTKAATTILVLILVLYAGKSFHRTFAWKSSKALWLATQPVSPYSYRVYNNLGDVYINDGNYQEAIKNFQISLQLKPDFADAVHNLGYTYIQLGDLNLAEQYLKKSFEMNPMLFQSLYKLGYIEFKRGNILGAQRYFEESLKVNPMFDSAQQALNALKSIPGGTFPANKNPRVAATNPSTN